MEALNFYLDQDNRPLKEVITLASLEKSPFKEQYQNALSEIESYLKSLTDECADRDMEYANNIFAFTGDRGSGKTSCMVSVGCFLVKDKELRKEFKSMYPYISDINFYTLDLMDPSYFDTKHNILSLFLAKMYSAFQKLTRNNENIKESKKIEFISSLSRAQKHAHLLIDNESDNLITNKVEELECLSVAVDLKEDIKTLVDNFLDCLDGKYNIILLRIDDIDLNAQEAGIMSELIRKYFIIPNLLVLTALKMDQLEIIKQNEFAKSFNLEKNDPQAIEMAERYLTKLFPHSQRIYLPDIEDLLTRKLVITSNSQTVEFPSVQQCVLELIFNKTRYLFYNSPVHANYIIPRNLRDLRQIIKLLWTMEDYDESIDANYNIVKKGKYNQAIFKKYLSEVWIKNNLEISHQDIARQILYTEELMRLNSYVIQELDVLYSGNELVNDCADESNSICNISLGDVLGIIEYKYNKNNDDEAHKFYFFIKTVYSIRLYEAYNKLTDVKKVPPTLRASNNSNQTLSEILRDSQYSNIQDFEKIVSGYYVNVKLQPIFSRDLALDNRFLVGGEFLELMRFCSSNFEIASQGSFVRLLEFFMLSVSHVKSLDVNFRRQDTIVYNEHISLGDSLVFDLGAFFFNITRIRRCYDRFRGYFYMPDGQDLVDAILGSDQTLCHDFKEIVSEKYSCTYNIPNDQSESLNSYYESRWLSYCSFRNIEVLQDFLKFIQKFNVNRDKTERENLAAFFDECAKYSIRIYSRKTKESGTCSDHIQFEFLGKIAKVLYQSNIDGHFVLIFGENPNNSSSKPVESHF